MAEYSQKTTKETLAEFQVFGYILRENGSQIVTKNVALGASAKTLGFLSVLWPCRTEADDIRSTEPGD